MKATHLLTHTYTQIDKRKQSKMVIKIENHFDHIDPHNNDDCVGYCGDFH